MLAPFIDQLTSRVALSPEQVRDAVNDLVNEQLPSDAKAEFLTALATKGETVDEIAAFANALRELSVPVPIDPATRMTGILDVCGTGGDRLNTFNISTTVALIAASAGVSVAKHGNRAITSQSGSADVLEALGIPVDLPPEVAARHLADHQFAFFFAPRYHPAFRHIAPARKLCAERGQRTIFNVLGPLLNPARPSAQLLGVPLPALCEPIARVLQSLGIRRGMVVCGAVPRQTGTAHLDELSTLGKTCIAEFHHTFGFSVSDMGLENLPVQAASLADLAGGDRETNAGIVRSILAGTERGPKRDAVLLNAGAALLVGGKARSISEGWEMAESLIDSGRAWAKLEALARD
jgi:anthranilate phosphoribosyltransferase